jgi:hypothetical protein
MGFESTYLWEDPIQSGVIFGSVFASLISICYYSLISVCAYGSLTALLAVLSLKVYTYVMVTFLKKEVPCNPLAKVAGKSNKTFDFFKYLGEKNYPAHEMPMVTRIMKLQIPKTFHGNECWYVFTFTVHTSSKF